MLGWMCLGIFETSRIVSVAKKWSYLSQFHFRVRGRLKQFGTVRPRELGDGAPPIFMVLEHFPVAGPALCGIGKTRSLRYSRQMSWGNFQSFPFPAFIQYKRW